MEHLTCLNWARRSMESTHKFSGKSSVINTSSLATNCVADDTPQTGHSGVTFAIHAKLCFLTENGGQPMF